MGKVIVLDAGHGGSDPGAISGSRQEKDDALRLALAVEPLLKERGMTVIMTRSDDSYPTLPQRTAMANSAKADLYVSLHRNSYTNATANGVEVWVYTTAGADDEKAATAVLEQLVAVGVQSNRGIKKGNYHVLRESNMTAMLVELGFISNAADNQLFDRHFHGYAQAIAKGICLAMGADIEQDNDVNKDKGLTPIMGSAQATASQCSSYLLSVNPNAADAAHLAGLYISEGEAEGVRGDIAFAQSCLETGNFTFTGSAVTFDQNNFCGMGVTATGEKGNSFATPRLGIRAQIQHLKAYASTEKLANECVDPRFQYVTRGVAPYVEYLGAQENPQKLGWAMGAGYGEKILGILSAIRNTESDNMDDGEANETQPQTIYRIQVGAFANRTNAEAFLETLRGMGLEAFLVTDEMGKKE